ncbi:MAG: FliM/FliN family flagellar motor switch protein [Terriglobales bacterium]
MATAASAPPLPPPAAAVMALAATPAPSADALAPLARAPEAADGDRWEDLQWLPCALTVELSVPHFTVGDVLRMAPQSVVETRWQQNADVPIRANGQLLAWAEFEGVDEKLAVRVTRLAE